MEVVKIKKKKILAFVEVVLRKTDNQSMVEVVESNIDNQGRGFRNKN